MELSGEWEVPQFGIKDRGTAASQLSAVAGDTRCVTQRGWRQDRACPSATTPSPVALAEARALAPSRVWPGGRRGHIPAAAPTSSSQDRSAIACPVPELSDRSLCPG